MSKIVDDFPLRHSHTFATEAIARFAATITQGDDLLHLRETNTWKLCPKLVLGAGSNTLFQQNYPGLVIFNHIKGIELVKENNQHIWLKIGAGENWHELVQYCIKHDYAGIENLSLIPGTVGAAPIQNIGAYGVELESVFYDLHAVELSTGNKTIFTHSDCHFGYRFSIFKHELQNQYCITHVTLRLNKTPTYHLDYGNIKEVLNKMGIISPSLKSISDAVITIRRKKLPDPSLLPNAGSFFKNPIISHVQFESLLHQYPKIPHYTHENNTFKIPAAWLIEQCGWRGKRCGPVGVHENQALVLINYSHGSGDDICKLAEAIRADVKKAFSIELQSEVSIINV